MFVKFSSMPEVEAHFDGKTPFFRDGRLFDAAYEPELYGGRVFVHSVKNDDYPRVYSVALIAPNGESVYWHVGKMHTEDKQATIETAKALGSGGKVVRLNWFIDGRTGQKVARLQVWRGNHPLPYKGSAYLPIEKFSRVIAACGLVVNLEAGSGDSQVIISK